MNHFPGIPPKWGTQAGGGDVQYLHSLNKKTLYVLFLLGQKFGNTV